MRLGIPEAAWEGADPQARGNEELEASLSVAPGSCNSDGEENTPEERASSLLSETCCAQGFLGGGRRGAGLEGGGPEGPAGWYSGIA